MLHWWVLPIIHTFFSQKRKKERKKKIGSPASYAEAHRFLPLVLIHETRPGLASSCRGPRRFLLLMRSDGHLALYCAPAGQCLLCVNDFSPSRFSVVYAKTVINHLALHAAMLLYNFSCMFSSWFAGYHHIALPYLVHQYQMSSLVRPTLLDDLDCGASHVSFSYPCFY